MKYRMKNGIYIRGLLLTAMALVLLCVQPRLAYAAAETLKVGYSDSNGIFVGEKGEAVGYPVEYMEELCKYTGWKIEYVPYSWEACLAALERGDVDMMVMTRHTPERGERFLYSGLSMGSNHAVIFAAPSSDIYYLDHEAMEGCRIGVAGGTVVERSLHTHNKELHLNCEIVPYATEKDAYVAFLGGEVDLFAGGASSSYPELKVVDRCGVSPTYIITNRENQELMSQINVAMQQLSLDDPDLQAQLSEKYQNTSSVGLQLTREEHDYLASAGAIDVRMFPNRNPIIYYEGDAVKGILPDYLDAIGAVTGLRFNYIQAETPSAVTEAPLLANDGSLMLTSSTAVAQQPDLLQSGSILQLDLAYVKRISDTAEFRPQTFALLKNMAFLSELFAQDYTVLTYDSVDECMNAVLDGEADMTIQFELVATHLLQKPKYTTKLMEWVGADYALDVYLYGAEEYAPLFSLLDKSMKSLSETERSGIVSAALMDHSYTMQLSDLLYQYNWVILLVIMAALVLCLVYLLRRRMRRGEEQARENEELHRRLWMDEMTGLYNREGFYANAEEMISRLQGEAVVVRANIWRLKQFNELYGLENGDMIIRAVGSRLKKIEEHCPVVIGRLSADHFYLCVAAADMERLPLVRQIDVPSLSLDVNMTYGVYPVDLDRDIQINVMCDRADLANVVARPTEERFVHYYSDAENKQLRYEQMIEQDMERALRENQFVIYIQPKYDIATEVIIGGEVLVRWLHPEQGLIPPGKFIELFERNGFIRELDYCVWEKCCEYLSERKRSGLSVIPLSFNMSRVHFYGFESILYLTELMERYGLEPKDVELEITESLCAEKPDMLFEKCRQLRDMGFRIAMDDFGSGYSSLSSLKEIPIDTLKMDLRFLAEDNSSDQADKGHSILRSVIELAHTIGLDVVVEGLETREQRDFIREIGSCAAQGYYYAKPMPAEDFTRLLQTSTVEEGNEPTSDMAANLRRERLRREQRQPMLEMVSVSENLFAYLLPEREAIVSWQMAQRLNCPLRIANFGEHVEHSGTVSPASLPQWKALIEAADRGERSGSAIVEYLTPMGKAEVHWLRFDTVTDFEGNPLVAMFSLADFGDIKSQVDVLVAGRQTQAEVENRRLKENQKLLSIIAQHSDRVVCLYDVAGRTSRVWNEESCKSCRLPHLCRTTADCIMADDSFTPEGKDALCRMFDDIDRGVSGGDVKLRVYSEDGELHWYDLLYSTICDEQGKPETAIISHKDVTRQYEHEMAYLRQYQALSETEASLGLMEADLTADRIELQDSLFAPANKSGVGGSLKEFASHMIPLKMEEENWEEGYHFFSPEFLLKQYEKGNRLLSRTWPLRFLSGKRGWVRFDVELIADIYSGHIRAYFRLWDVTTIKEKQMELQERSERDGMTGVYNRTTAENLIREKLETDTSLGMFIVLDLDRLKQINDTMGHAMGDKAIKSVAEVMKSHFRGGDILGRIGGDEFVVYMPGAAKNREVIAGTITELLRKLGTLSVGEQENMAVTCSVGCVVVQNDSTYESLYKQADKALYHVKKSGRNNFAFYSPEMESESYSHQMDKLFTLDHAKRSESSEVQQLLTAISEYYHLVLCCNVTENSYHLMQEVKDGIFSKMPTFGKMDTMVQLSMMRMTEEDAKRFHDAVSRPALMAAGERGEKHVTIYFEFQDIDGKYYPAECTSILYRNEKDDICEFAMIRWRR